MFGWIASKIGGEAVKGAVEGVGGILDELFTSDEERLDKQALLTRLAQRPNMAQTKINEIEATHRSMFVAGWRPFIGWVCGLALLYNFVLRDLVGWAMRIWAQNVTPLPALDMGVLMTVLMGMLGLGGLRTVEKLSGKSK